ncbi:GNAT family N-acetyltransferase [Roseivirga sp. E12]|uniref:GNAT family N-acetyltransferase n=1 Tax=Roseivirga sp. E12 TaxID=2819237 RepID=UPI001ABC0E69|nr:GNAT family N-acetyltransferase [Roseivirga sp. E12]MBO3696900.1 GNAT family N-acetyltransferase [Roseivirga sp. E12]
MKPDITLRIATIEDLETLLYWDKQQHVIDADPDDDWDWTNELKQFPSWREQLMAQLEGRPLGFIQIIDPYLEETHYWGDVPKNLRAIDIWIGEADDLGKGYGTEMMRQAIERCFAAPEVTAILIDPLVTNVKAIRFYERMGYEFVEERLFGDGLCAIYRLDRKNWAN